MYATIDVPGMELNQSDLCNVFTLLLCHPTLSENVNWHRLQFVGRSRSLAQRQGYSIRNLAHGEFRQKTKRTLS